MKKWMAVFKVNHFLKVTFFVLIGYTQAFTCTFAFSTFFFFFQTKQSNNMQIEVGKHKISSRQGHYG